MEQSNLNNYLNKQDENRIKKLYDENQFLSFRIEMEQSIIQANIREIQDIAKRLNAVQNR